MKKMIKYISLLLVFTLLAVFTPKQVNAFTYNPDVNTTGTTYYTSPTGKSSNTGLSKDSPLDVYTAIYKLRAGDTLSMASGTYICDDKIILNENGTPHKKISVIADSLEKTVFDFSSMVFDSTNRGIQIIGDYWYFYGIDVTGAGDNGMYIAGNHNFIEFCEFYSNKDSGLQLGRGGGNDVYVDSWPSYNIIKNCTSYNNYDDVTYGENADGFAAKLTVGYGNVFDGCIAFRNSDDGWDLYAKSDTGNVGTVIIKNCASFENGWLLDGTKTRDGDGIGFKLGGSNMEGDVIISNCMAWNNRLHGFSDNSNPRTIIASNLTAYNNSVSVVDGLPGPSDGGSANFDLARNEQSYNVYYGLLSYCTNQTATNVEYEGGDDFLGSVSYSIFNTSKNTYKAITSTIDGSIYDSSKMGTTYSGLSDASFASLSLGYDVSEYPNLHKLLRNADGSINMGDTLRITSSSLLTFCDGKSIGATLNKTSWEEYEHYEYTEVSQNATQDEIELQAAYDALELMCNPNAIFQDFPLWTSLNKCQVTWTSEDAEIFEIGKSVYQSYSGVTYVTGIVHRSRFSDLEVKLTATITLNNLTKTKEFTLKLIKDNPKLGEVIGLEDSYIVDLYSRFTEPEVKITNKNSYSNQTLKLNIDYMMSKKYEYAESKMDEFNEVSKVYTSVPGVYKVTYNFISLINKTETLKAEYLVYVVSPNAEIDFVDYAGYEFFVCKDGVTITGSLSNVSGKLHVYLSPNETETVESVIENGVTYDITSDTINEVVKHPNDSKYFIHVVIENNGKTYQSQVYTEEVTMVEISTCQEFYDLVNGKTSSVVIYLLTNDLDFSQFTWNESKNTETFEGLLNGNGYTISNLTIENASSKNVNLIYKLKGGTIMNIKFDNIKLLGSNKTSQNVGIVGQMVGGYVHNVSLTNITATGYQSVAGMVAKVCGGDNYFSQISLVNAYEFDSNYKLKEGYPYIEVVTKYCGGIIGNVQKDTSEDRVHVTVENCYADAYVGTGIDSGGYIGGIVGRVKNDFTVTTIKITHCIFDGVVETAKNYCGGIIAGSDYGTGEVTVLFCVSRPVIIFGLTRSILDGVTPDQWGNIGLAQKTASPILGRYTAGTGAWTIVNNFATFGDYHSIVGSTFEEIDLTDVNVYKNNIGFDMEVWQYSEVTKGLVLKFAE